MPFIRDGEHVQQMVEPIAEVVLAPTFGDSDRIPNEDSQDFEFEEGNLFGLNRFPGLDRVEEGPRVNYGVEWSMFQNTGARVSVFTGQSYRFVEDDIFPKNSGLDNNVSDVVNAVDIAPGDYISLIYRNRVNVEDGKVARHELGATGGVEAIRANLSYVRYDGQEQEGLDGREEVDFSLTSQLTRMWRSRIYGITDLKNGGAQRELGIRFTYEDECFLFSIGYERQDIEDRDIEPSDAVYFRIGFKTLGAAGTTVQTGGGGSRRDGAGQGGG
jgi:LPS-assembly protein